MKFQAYFGDEMLLTIHNSKCIMKSLALVIYL
jgi:hypothetical protein